MTTRFDGLLVDHAALDQAHGDIRVALSAIDDRLDRLERELAPLSSDWGGQAQRAYATSKQRWDGAIGEMKAILAEVGDGVSRSNAEYSGADRSAAAGFGHI